MAPMKRGDWVPDDPREFSQLKKQKKKLFSTRQAAEWGMQTVQGSLSFIELPMLALDHKFGFKVIKLAVQLHQMQC